MNNLPENNSAQEGRPEPLITRRELAKLCKVSTRTVDNWVANKSIPVIRCPGKRCVRFSWAEVVDHLLSAEDVKYLKVSKAKLSERIAKIEGSCK